MSHDPATATAFVIPIILSATDTDQAGASALPGPLPTRCATSTPECATALNLPPMTAHPSPPCVDRGRLTQLPPTPRGLTALSADAPNQRSERRWVKNAGPSPSSAILVAAGRVGRRFAARLRREPYDQRPATLRTAVGCGRWSFTRRVTVTPSGHTDLHHRAHRLQEVVTLIEVVRAAGGRRGEEVLRTLLRSL